MYLYINKYLLLTFGGLFYCSDLISSETIRTIYLLWYFEYRLKLYLIQDLVMILQNSRNEILVNVNLSVDDRQNHNHLPLAHGSNGYNQNGKRPKFIACGYSVVWWIASWIIVSNAVSCSKI